METKTIIGQKQVQAELTVQGYSHLCWPHDLTINAIEKLLRRVFQVTDISYDKTNSRLLKSSRGMELHTDHQDARYIAWQCLSQAAIGGESVLLDTKEILPAFSQKELACLERVMVISHAVKAGDRFLYPLFKKHTQHTQLFYAPWMLMEMKSTQEEETVLKFRSLVEKADKTEIKLSEGDWLIIDNHRMLHGRNGFSESAGRLLKRYWIKENH